MINEIKLNNDSFNEYKCKSANADDDNIIEELRKINIFIGANNSGKSRLIRRLFAGHRYSYSVVGLDVNEFKSALLKSLDDVEITFRNYKEISSERITNRIKSSLTEIFYFNESTNGNDVIDKIDQVFGLDSEDRNHAMVIYYTVNYSNLLKDIKNEYLGDFINTLNEVTIQYEKYYIPILRSLKGLSPKQEVGIHAFEDLYRNHTLQEYFKGDDSLNIFTGLSLYEDVTKLLLGDSKERNKIRDFENFLSESFFGKDVNIVPRIAEKTLHIKIGGEEKAIHELGDGVQSIIMLTYPLFMHQGEQAIFFFEEPETHLHPGYQRLFLETLEREEFEDFQYFITTHSNHFLDITPENDNMSIYTFVKEENDKEPDNPSFHIHNVAAGDDNVLRLIGVNKSSVFLSNSTIWVEGITDRMYLRKYLDLFQKANESNGFKPFIEDYHYSFVEYGGSNITHWSFLDSEDDNHPNINIDRLCAKSFVLTDSDNAKAGSKKQKRQEKLEAKLGKERYQCLESREVENLLTKEVVEKTIKTYQTELEDDSFGDFKKKYSSKQKVSDQIQKNIPAFTKKIFKSDGNFTDKVEFAKKAIEHIHHFNDMSTEAKELAEKVYKFIAENNKKR